MIRASAIAVLTLVLCSPTGLAQSAKTVFSGRPSIKISEGGVERLPEQLPREKAVNLGCVISQIGDSYYWASRENVELARIDSGGAFVTYLALNGSGYVRFIKPEFKKAAALVSPAAGQFDYVEHLLLGLESVTYYGRRQ